MKRYSRTTDTPLNRIPGIFAQSRGIRQDCVPLSPLTALQQMGKLATPNRNPLRVHVLLKQKNPMVSWDAADPLYWACQPEISYSDLQVRHKAETLWQPNHRKTCKYSGKWIHSLSALCFLVWQQQKPVYRIQIIGSLFPWSLVDQWGSLSLDHNAVSLLCSQIRNMTSFSNDQVVCFTLDEVQSARIRNSRTLLGRLFSEGGLTTVELRDAINKPWQGQGRIKVKMVAHNLYEFVLPSETAKNWVLKQSPWVIADKIIHLRPWLPTITQRTFDELAVAPFRIQLWEIPEDCCTQRFGRKVATAMLGRVLEAGVYSCSESGQRFIKIKALLDFSKPLRSQFLASNEEMGEFWIRLKYEYLPTFCYKCGRVGHSRQTCSFDPPTRQERFGHHMTTKKLGRRVFEEEEGGQAFPGHHKSVWVNTSAQERREARQPNPPVNPYKREAGQTGRPMKEESPLWMGSSTQPFLTTEARQQQGRTKSRFPIVKSPKIQMGRLSRRGKLKKACDDSSRPMPPGEVEELSLTRRRRLIPENESEDEFIVQKIPKSATGCPLNSAIRAAKLVEKPVPAGVNKSPLSSAQVQAKQGGGRRMEHSPAATGETPLRPRKMRLRPAHQNNTKKKGGTRARPSEKGEEALSTHMPAQTAPLGPQPEADVLLGPQSMGGSKEGLGSIESASEADDQDFVIRRRDTKTQEHKTKAANVSRVRQAVRAFEAGLSLNEPSKTQIVHCPPIVEPALDGEKTVNEVEISASDFNEYGSNFSGPSEDGKKRRIDEVEGDIADLPSPKKLFVEDKDDLDSVEVASREWPHPDK
ncbi:unnamed protein product [Linum trigynum]|uniref:CCHC-type domain-containing protein n=1 Tax=Linum trigynum TaxID=586398 RepID=A0AAV2DN24_9ROSI